MVLGKLPVSGRPANLDKSRARAFCACSRCGCGLFGYFFSLRLSFLFIRPFEKRSYYVIPLGVRPSVRLSVRPSVNFFVSV